MEIKRPNSKRNLDMALRRLGNNDEDYLRIRTSLANAIVAQMLPNGAVKGGTSLKIRFGEEKTRATIDFDAARASGLEDFIEEFEDMLEAGWNGFSARLVRRQPASPKDVPSIYVMQPYDVKLSYLGAPWCTVPFELGHDELGDAQNPDLVVPEAASKILLTLGFPELHPIPLMRLSHQVAQKLHGASEPHSRRAHDLVDLQLIVSRESIDFAEIRDICEQLFAYRKMQTWPPVIKANENWKDLYGQQALGLDVCQDVDDAIDWANDLIKKICKS